MPNSKFFEWWKMPQIQSVMGLRQPGVTPNGDINTGAGPDGIVQPNKPTMAIGNTMVHEDETLKPDGTVIPSAQTAITPTDQDNLANLEQAGNFIGMQTGGTSADVGSVVRREIRPGSTPETTSTTPIDTGSTNVQKNITTSGIGLNPVTPQMSPLSNKTAAIGAKPIDIKTPEIPKMYGTPEPEKSFTGLDKLKGVMKVEDPYFQNYMDKQLQDQAAADTARQAAATHDAASRGADAAAIGGMQQSMSRDAMQQQGDITAQTAIGQQEQAIGAARDVIAENRKVYTEMLDRGDTEGAAKYFADSINSDGIDLSRVEDDIQWTIENRGYEDMVGMMDKIQSWVDSGVVDTQTAQTLGGVMKNSMFKAVLKKADFSETDTEAFMADLNTSIDTGDPVSPEVGAKLQALGNLVESFEEQHGDSFNTLATQHSELFDGSEKNTDKLGLIAGAYINQQNAKPVSAEGIAALKEVGLYDEAMDESLRVDRVKLNELNTLAETAGGSGSFSKFKTQYDQIVAGDPAFAEEHPISEFVGQIESFQNAEGSVVYPSEEMVDEIMNLGVDGSSALIDGSVLTGDLWFENTKGIYGSTESKRWSLRPEIQSFIDANKGKLAIINGKPYFITGDIQENKNKRGDRALVVLYDPYEKKFVLLGKK